MKNIEIWKSIPNYEGYYLASSFGRVKSLERMKQNHSKTQLVPEIILSQTNCGNGYLKVTLSVNTIKKTFRVHQLIAMTFLNHKPSLDRKIVVDHIDNNKKNNMLNNIAIVTNRFNTSKDKFNKNGYTGVSTDRNGRFRAMIREGNKKIHIGCYDTAILASEAYNNYLVKIISRN